MTLEELKARWDEWTTDDRMMRGDILVERLFKVAEAAKYLSENSSDGPNSSSEFPMWIVLGKALTELESDE
jgi:hypothetical protein